MRKSTVFLTASFLQLFYLAHFSHASYTLLSKEELIKYSRIIFIGSVIKVDSAKWYEPIGLGRNGDSVCTVHDELYFTFKVEEVLKGDLIEKEIVLISTRDQYNAIKGLGDSDLLQPDKNLLVFAGIDKDGAWRLIFGGFPEIIENRISKYEMSIQEFKEYAKLVLKSEK